MVHNMKPLLTLTAFFIFAVSLTACNNKPESPFEVTQSFWHAVENKNIRQIKKLISVKSLQDNMPGEHIVAVSKITLGKIIIDGNRARVETTLVIESDEPTTVHMDTLLVKEDDQWKVDYQDTMEALQEEGQLSQVIRELKNFGEKLSTEFDKSMQELDHAMPEIEKGINDLGDKIKKEVPKIKKQIEEMAEELQRALEKSLKEDEKQKSI